jgi:hypothetical protein
MKDDGIRGWVVSFSHALGDGEFGGMLLEEKSGSGVPLMEEKKKEDKREKRREKQDNTYT